jgi:ATP-dependent DNA helicase RecG
LCNFPVNGYTPPLQHVKIYFNEKGAPEIEAEKFFNHYEARGWLNNSLTPILNLIGATNRPADLDTIVELERQKRHISFDEEICYDVEFQELDLSPLLEKFDNIEKPLNQDKLINLKLIKKDNEKVYPTNALMIILGKFPHCTVKCARFKGTTMDVFIDKKEYGGDIFSVLENTQAFVLNHINLKT